VQAPIPTDSSERATNADPFQEMRTKISLLVAVLAIHMKDWRNKGRMKDLLILGGASRGR